MLIDTANIIREKRRTVKMVINNGGQLYIYCPVNLPYSKLSEIVSSKEKLLLSKLNKQNITNNKYKEIINFNRILLLGKEYLIVPSNRVGKAYFTEDSFVVPNKYYEDNYKLQLFIKKNLREIANKIILERLKNISLNINSNVFNYKKAVIGNFKSKWGSCDSERVLKFNWKLIMADIATIDFVIYHELSHLVELNHSKNFYNCLNKLCPNWKEGKRKLKELAFLLTIY